MSIPAKLVLVASFLFSAHAFASNEVACGQYLPCGTFEGSVVDIDAPHDLIGTETVTITAGSGSQMKMEGALTTPDGKVAWSYKFLLDFDSAGNFKIIRQNSNTVAGTGTCSVGVCPHSFSNIPNYGTVGVISYKNDVIHRSQVNQSAEGDVSGIISTLKRK